MRKILTAIIMAGVSLMFSGCGHFTVHAKPIIKDGKTEGLRLGSAHVKTPDLDNYPHKNYYKDTNIEYRCAYNYALYVIADKALSDGYEYFSVEFEKGSNRAPLAINSIDKLDRYCNAPHWDKDTDLLEDKCGHIGFGNGYPINVKTHNIKFHKQRNPLVPLWNARATKRDTWNTLSNECYPGNTSALQEMLENSRS